MKKPDLVDVPLWQVGCFVATYEVSKFIVKDLFFNSKEAPPSSVIDSESIERRRVENQDSRRKEVIL